VATQAAAAQVPQQHSYAAAQPYAVRSGAVGPAGQRGHHLYPAPQGRSIGVKLLIGVAIAFGALVVVGILAAVAIPVFLNQRAQSASPAPLTLPDTAAGLVRSEQPDTDGLSDKWLSAPIPGRKVAAYYDTPAGKHRALVLLSQLKASPAQQSAFLDGTKNSAANLGVTGLHAVDVGEAGGQLQCGGVAKGGGTVCGFAAPDMVGTVTVIGGSADPDALVVRMLEAIRHPAS
jgi:hypothetical protein